MRPSMLLLSALLIGCAGDKDDGDADGVVSDLDSDADTDADADADSDTDADADSDTDSDTDADTGDTGTTGYPTPTSLTVACTVTGNLLRYTCDVTVDPAQPVQLSWMRTDSLGPERVHTSDVAATDHTIDVYFMAPQQEYDFVATATNWPKGLSASELHTTGLPPTRIGSWLNMTGTAATGLIATETPCDGDAFAVIYDTSTGDLVWYQNLDPSGELGLIHMVRFTDEMTIIGETGGQIVEVDIMGNDLVRFPVSYPGCCSLNHDIFKADGLFYSQFQNTTGSFPNTLTVDNIVAIDELGVEQWQWDAKDHLTIPPSASGDYLHTNSEYVDADGNFYLSWLTQDTVGKFVGDPLDPNWGAPIWLMRGDGTPGDLGNDITLDWSAVSPPARFGGQHNAHLTHDGRVMLLDNDGGRALIITIDELTMTGTVDAEFPTHENQCFPQGTAMDSTVGNVLAACYTDWVREYDPTGTMLWEAQIECRDGGGFFGDSVTRWYPLDAWQ